MIVYLPIFIVGSLEGSTLHSKWAVSPSRHSTLLRCEMKTGTSYVGSIMVLVTVTCCSSSAIFGNASGCEDSPMSQSRSVITESSGNAVCSRLACTKWKAWNYSILMIYTVTKLFDTPWKSVHFPLITSHSWIWTSSIMNKWIYECKKL